MTQEALLDRLPEFGHEVVCLDRDRAELDALGDSSARDRRRPRRPRLRHLHVRLDRDAEGRLGHAPEPLQLHPRHGRGGSARTARRTSSAWSPAISTDLGNTAFFPALCSGGTLALVKPEVAADPAAFALRVAESPLDVLKITPSHLSALLKANDGRVLPRHWLILGGERLGWDLVDRVRSLSDCRILNHYGPTETTVGSCTMLVEDGPGSVRARQRSRSAGRSRTRAATCWTTGSSRRRWMSRGRLFIGGAGVARGYIGQPELTAERFLADPFAAAGARIYDTGDLVRRLPDGTLEFLGRADEQVKIRGFRVEPSEVESALRSHPAVANAAVVAARGDGRRRPARGVLRAPPSPATADDLRRHVAGVGARVHDPVDVRHARRVAADGKRQGRPARAAGPRRCRPGRRTGTTSRRGRRSKRRWPAIWADVLGLERVSVEADFFALGGHSLLATQVVAQVRTDFAIDLPLHSLFVCSDRGAVLHGDRRADGCGGAATRRRGCSESSRISRTRTPSQLVSEFGRGDEAV